MMEYRFLGASGLKVSALSLGSWVTFGSQLDEDEAGRCMEAAWERGVNFFDNAEVYADGLSERIMGRVLKKKGWKRSDYLVSTKLFWGGKGPNDRGLSRKHILEGMDASLKRLGLDYVDLVFCHRPDIHTPLEETVRAMDHLVRSGKALYWGTSEWEGWRIREAFHLARREHLVPPTMEQPQYNMFHRERVEKEYASLYEDFGLGTTIWSPLAGGILTGKYNQGIPPDSRASLKGYEWLRERYTSEEGRARIAKVRLLEPIAREMDATPAQLALAWCLKNPRVSTVITGASRPSQVEENMKALEVYRRMTGDVMERIEAVLGNKPSPPYDFREM